ncbi:Rieske 2Fe-2S domain-containing protein [uncultured Arthrobacter sp.]|uniref:Rieske 2Fe-2S domain-containing protein n=1 Tax=uncultured Arthrobacter sp. TaxID=114050 RepID=UPI0028D851EC|nr:Rieske 2Fe-2S domain-containing protein [uncultured Arthrobacter sp.]
MNPLHALVDAIEHFDRLDGVAAAISKAAGKAVQPRFIRNTLSGTSLGHPLHPVLTDFPIGAWTMATVLDTVGGPASEPAADILVAVGIATAVPTAAAGLNDWSDTQGKSRRVGLVHAVANGSALCLFSSSAIARASGSRTIGKALGLAGFGVLMFGGFLGGHLSYGNAVNVNKTAGRTGPKKWTPVLAESELADGDRRKVDAGNVSVLLYRSGSGILALDSVCSHMGGPLEEGTIADGCVTCPWHGSTFRLGDGHIVRGPATTPQPSYEARVNDGQIEVRRRAPWE